MSAIGTFGTAPVRSQPQPAAYALPLVLRWIETMLERRRSRLALMEMTDDQLKDIGVSRAEAYGEATRPFWD